MATFRGVLAGLRWMNRSSPTAGLIAHRMCRRIISDSCQQPTRQEMHLRISCGLPARALLAQYGSATICRERPTRSAFPSARILSQ